MSLRFIVGRAGTGKTKYILDEITKLCDSAPAGAPVILLVPEQATFQMEYALAASARAGGSIRAHVLSFRRLAYRVFMETGGAARVPVGELGKRMVLRRLLDRQRTSLQVFGKVLDRPGFADCLARVIGEMKSYLVSPAMLDEVFAALGDNDVLLRSKLHDTALLYRELDNFLSPRYTDPDDYLNLLAEKIAAAASFRGAVFWVDGFKGFTPQETKVMAKILSVAAEVNMALCLDHNCLDTNIKEDHLFYPTWKTFRELSAIAAQNRVSTKKPLLLNQPTPYRFNRCSDIAHLERSFFTYPAPICEGEAENITLISAANRRAEVEACAREILRLARERDYRWRDMAVAVRDLEPYHELIRLIFADHGIPFFIDRKQGVMHHPLIELIRSALETVLKNWTYDPVFRYLKTDLVPVTREDVFLLENYVLAHGIRGTKWIDGSDWHYLRRYTLGEDREAGEEDTAYLAMVNTARTRAASSLANFSRSLEQAKDVREITTALCGLLDELKAADQTDVWRTEAEKAGNLNAAGENAQIWAGVVKLLDEIMEALGDEEVSLDTYAGILDAGLATMTLGLIPPGLDQVIVGSLDRSRNPEVKAQFLLGASDGVLPARAADGGIFSDAEREKLLSRGIDLAPGGRKRVFEEQFLVYTALTRSSEKLCISWPTADDDGRSMPPSPVIARIQELLPGLRPDNVPIEPDIGGPGEPLGFLVHPGRSLVYLTEALREAFKGIKINPIWWELYNWFVAGRPDAGAGTVIRSIFHANTADRIKPELTASLYGRPVKASVSRIEKFRACPFAHFSMYGLKLKDRGIFRLAAPDMGEFFHAALKMFAEGLRKNSVDWGSLSWEDCARLSEGIIEELAPQLQSEILLSTARYRYLTRKLKRNIDRAAAVLAEHARRGLFRPVGLELAFGPGGDLPPLKLDLPGGGELILSGRIDRLDMAEKDGTVYLRVIDYKSGDNTLSINDIYHGLRLQLLTYLHVALSHFPVSAGRQGKPGGIFYFTVKDPLINSRGPMPKEDVERAVLARLKMKGLALADTRVFSLMDGSAGEGSSQLFHIGLKKGGGFRADAPVIDDTRFGLLRSYTEKILTESAREIVTGNVGIRPYRTRQISACRFCSFRPVCHFDTMVAGNAYRTLITHPNDKIWPLIGGKGGFDEQDRLD